jgi:hypothetical protein
MPNVEASTCQNALHDERRPVTDWNEHRRPLSRDQLRTRIAGEFRDMAGLSLTLPQASRLFGLETALCERLLNELVAAGFLQRRQDDSYERTG